MRNSGFKSPIRPDPADETVDPTVKQSRKKVAQIIPNLRKMIEISVGLLSTFETKYLSKVFIAFSSFLRVVNNSK